MDNFTHPIRFVEAAAPLIHLCWQMGWNEANGGNFSWRLPSDEVAALLAGLDPAPVAGPVAPLPHDEPTLDGEYFLVTGSGQFFRHALARPGEVFGIVRIVDGGTAWQRVWGFASGAKPTSEFDTHLTGHAVRKRVSNGRERMILHTHLPEFIALSFVVPLDSETLNRALWEKMPECIVLFPDGVRVIPPLLPGTPTIAAASAVELEKSRVISWSHHGIFVSEETPDRIFALVETIEKAAGIHRKVLSAGGPKQSISTQILRELAEKFAPIMVCAPEWLDAA